MKANRLMRCWVAGLAVALGLGACSTREADTDGPGGEEQQAVQYQEGFINMEEPAGDPVAGGTLTVAAFIEPRTLDPAALLPAGSSGGIELLNIYDSLLRYDTKDKELVPQLAEDVEANDDFTEYTVRLRSEAVFSDGTPVNAEAVKASMDRYSSAKTAPEGALWRGHVASIEATDEWTVLISLKDSFPGFPNLLAGGPGMIVAPAAIAGGDFTPIGAGPFVVAAVHPGESVEMDRNPKYWQGEPPLESVRFVYYNDDNVALDALEAGSVDVAFLRYPNFVETVLEAGYPAYMNMVSASGAVMINASDGRPGNDVRVRRAMALAIDPRLVHERAFEGRGPMSMDLFPEYSRWHSQDATAPGQDVEAAKKLVEDAKDEGFDGHIEYLTSGSPALRQHAMSLKAQWEAVGFQVDVTVARTSVDLYQRGMSGDYDASSWAINLRESDPYSKLSAVAHSDGAQTYGMHTSPEMDALIDDFKAAPSFEDQQKVMTQIQQRYYEEVPFISVSPYAETVTWQKNVHGVSGAGNSMVLFGGVWKE